MVKEQGGKQTLAFVLLQGPLRVYLSSLWDHGSSVTRCILKNLSWHFSSRTPFSVDICQLKKEKKKIVCG